MTDQPTREDAPRSCTVGEDVLRVHELVGADDPRPKCGAGEGETVDEWLRAVNCPECR
ncbi:hypothetical protein [Streptomyces benahoarensis]|uniref:hypothetical protein n=1 Tax=Streptomyces benahoarensis TaxID=2595054 RepID=UPI00163D420C|nr:hypothetical protein [Streptomyces benahoarensis]